MRLHHRAADEVSVVHEPNRGRGGREYGGVKPLLRYTGQDFPMRRVS